MSMKNGPVITVFMAMYNGEKYVQEAVNSVLNQPYPHFELLIIDDGSVDNSFKIVSAIKDDRIRVLQNETNSGLYKTRNRGVKEARGEYFAILDCDDVALNDRLKAPLEFLEQNKDYVACFGLSQFIDGEGKALPSHYMFAGKHEWASVLSFFYNPFVNSASLIRTEVLRQFGYREGYEPVEDYDLMQRMIADGKVAILSKKLIKYRLHNSNISNIQGQKGAERHKKIIRTTLERFNPEDIELAVNRHYALYLRSLSDFSLKEIEEWLFFLLKRNKELNIYSERLFKKAISFEWMKMIYGNKSSANIMYGIRSKLFSMEGGMFFLNLSLIAIKERLSGRSRK